MHLKNEWKNCIKLWVKRLKIKTEVDLIQSWVADLGMKETHSKFPKGKVDLFIKANDVVNQEVEVDKSNTFFCRFSQSESFFME